MYQLFISATLLLLTSCSLAPFSTTKTANTLGDSNWAIDAGASAMPYVRVTRGFGDNFDLTASVEEQVGEVFSFEGKYAFINDSNKLSFAGLAGFFYGTDISETRGYYFAPIISYKKAWFETYALIKYNHVTWKGNDFSDFDDFYLSLVSYDDVSFNYLQNTLGFNFWFTDTFALSIYASYFHFLGDDVSSSESNVLPGLGLIWNL